MTSWIAFLRAVNVGGTGKLPMAELRELCTEAGFTDVRTYIQSGNVVFGSDLDADEVRKPLQDALEAHAGSRVDVMVRSPQELTEIVQRNPFPDAPGSKVGVAIGHHPIDAAVLDGIATPGGEAVAVGSPELYVYYPDGIGRSKLKLPTSSGPLTVRNMNTMTKLAAMARGG